MTKKTTPQTSCNTCGGDGNCINCAGFGTEGLATCGACNGSGKCSDCRGSGKS